MKLKNLITPTLSILLLAITPTTVVADEYIKELYQTYCDGCHSIEDTDAPLSFRTNEWSERLKIGMPALVDSAINGKGNMPPLGSCMECGYDELEELVLYMTSEPSVDAE